MVGITSQQSLALNIVKYTFTVASVKRSGHQPVQKAFDATISTLLASFEDAPEPPGFFEALADIITAVPDEVGCEPIFSE